MKLIDLEPEYIRYIEDGKMRIVNSLSEAQGIEFYCPKSGCDHKINITFKDRGVLDNQGSHNKEGKPTRWEVNGTDASNLTTLPSIHIKDTCGWHGFITKGIISSC